MTRVLGEDPTDFEGVPSSFAQYNQHEEGTVRKKKKTNAATGASAAGVRAVSSQFIAFYFRAPAKAFMRTRVDYMQFARAINPRIKANERWSWRTSTPGILAYAIKTHGWNFIPNQVLPPLFANITVGAVLYTSYLQFLGALHEPSSHAAKRVNPPPFLDDTFIAGFGAGAVQSIVAAPLDALQVRFKVSDMLEGQHKTMVDYSKHKLHEIGFRGVFAGWTLSFVKESLSYGVFFATFEYIKQQAYYGFVTRYYGSFGPKIFLNPFYHKHGTEKPIIKPHYALEPTFLLLAGIAASITQSVVQYPLSLLQNLHYGRLESLDYKAKLEPTNSRMLSHYYFAYAETYRQAKQQARRAGGWRRWFYKDFVWNTLRQTPSTSAGLIVFELVRRKYGNQLEAVRIEKDGYDILLS